MSEQVKKAIQDIGQLMLQTFCENVLNAKTIIKLI